MQVPCRFLCVSKLGYEVLVAKFDFFLFDNSYFFDVFVESPIKYKVGNGKRAFFYGWTIGTPLDLFMVKLVIGW